MEKELEVSKKIEMHERSQKTSNDHEQASYTLKSPSVISVGREGFVSVLCQIWFLFYPCRNDGFSGFSSGRRIETF